MKQKCIFSIVDIDCGWFDINFKTDENNFVISASDLYGHDSPKELLILLTDFMSEKTNCGYVLFDEEPGIYIVSLEKELLTVAYSEYDWIDDMERKGIYMDLRGNMTFSEISKNIMVDKIFLQTEIDINIFMYSVYKAFSRHANNFLLYDKYEENWAYFPQKEWEAFEQCIKQKGLYKTE